MSPGRIRTQNPNMGTVADPPLRQHGHWDRHTDDRTSKNKKRSSFACERRVFFLYKPCLHLPPNNCDTYCMRCVLRCLSWYMRARDAHYRRHTDCSLTSALALNSYISSHSSNQIIQTSEYYYINPLNPEWNPICYLLALLWAHHFLHVSRIRVKLLTFRLLMSYIYGAPILDVSRSHTTTQHSR